MSYDSTDLRSRLRPTSSTATQVCAAPQYFDFSHLEPDELGSSGSRTWWVRGQNFALAYTLALPGEHFERLDQPDEYVALFPRDPAAATVRAGDDSAQVRGAATVVLPPGNSTIETTAETHLVRLFSARSPELLARCHNHEAYSDPHANVAPFSAWPGPADGHRIRVYPTAENPYREGRFGRIFRCSTFMVNLFDPDHGPRDPAKLSPHHHDDFEQCSLAVDGEYVHHIRTPWGSDLAEWREDDHVHVASPSATIIPPPSVHTSQSTSQVRNQLVDIFCPPREDFSAQPGWVINEAEYPLPDSGAR